MASIRNDLTSLMVARGVGVLIPLLATPYLARVLEPSGFGLYVLGVAIFTVFSMLVKFGFELSSLREANLVRENSTKFRNVLSTTWAVQLALCSVLTIGVITALTFWIHEAELKSVTIIALLGAALSIFFPQWALQAYQKYRVNAWIIVISKLLMLLLTFTFVSDPSDAALALLLQFSWVIPAGITSIIVLRKSLGSPLFLPLSLHKALKATKQSLPFFISVLLDSAYTSLNPILLGSFNADSKQIGIYGAAQQLTGAARVPGDPIKQVFYPRLARAHSSGNSSNFKKLIKNYGLLVSGIYSVATIILVSFSEPIVVLYLGSEYVDVAPVLRWSAMVLIPWAFSYWAETILQAAGKASSSLYGPLFGAVAHLCYAWWFALNWGAIGVAAATLMTQVIISIVIGFQLFKSGVLK